MENVIVVVGNLAQDPELVYTDKDVAVGKLRVAVNRRVRDADGGWGDRLDGFWTAVVWREQAEHAADSLRKGDRVIVAGRVESRSYEDKDGVTRWVTEIAASEVGPSLRWAAAPVVKRRSAPHAAASAAPTAADGQEAPF